MPTLRVARGRSTAEEFPFAEEVRIGRAEECEVRVFDEAASRCHAIVRREGAEYVALDQRSLNGLYVNGKKVERHVLRTGDEITVRNLTLVFVADGAAERPTVVSEPLEIQSSIAEPGRTAVAGGEEQILARLAAVYRFADVLRAPAHRLRQDLVKALEDSFRPCRAALVLPDGNIGAFSRSVADHVRSKGEAILVREPRIDLPGATSLAREKILSAMAAPLERFGAVYVDRSTGDAFRPDELEFLAALASMAAPALRPPGPPLLPPPRRRRCSGALLPWRSSARRSRASPRLPRPCSSPARPARGRSSSRGRCTR